MLHWENLEKYANETKSKNGGFWIVKNWKTHFWDMMILSIHKDPMFWSESRNNAYNSDFWSKPSPYGTIWL